MNTIADVLTALDQVVERAWAEESRLGYFAALYRRVTRRVQQGLANGEFHNPTLLERLDVVFAGRYLQAHDDFRAGRPVSQCWQVAFDGAGESQPLVLQHLLAGMNAHINYDLGIACAECSPGPALAQLQPDFDQINQLLAGQLGAVEQELAAVWPGLRLLDRVGLRTANRFINFDMQVARDFAWHTAEAVNAAPPGGRAVICAGLDGTVAELGRSVLEPPLLVRAELLPIRWQEPGAVQQVLTILGAAPAAAAASA